jgi:ABC-2 type transport system ATP-binding protein
VPVECAELGRDYRHHPRALDSVTLSLLPGVTGLIGVNGAGKSTLLRILAGALKPTRGTLRVDGLDPYGADRSSVLRRTALMPQSLDLPRDARVVDAVAYCGWLRGMSTREAQAGAARVLHRVGLADRAADKIRSLSGGMHRRVALAQSLVAHPDLLLLDEPTTGLDPEQRAMLRGLVDELPRDCTMVVSSHVMEDLETLADHIVILDTGRVVYTGALGAFRDRWGGPERSAEHAFLSLLTTVRRSP